MSGNYPPPNTPSGSGGPDGSGPRGPQYQGPGQGGPSQGGPSQGGPSQGGPSQGGPYQGGPYQGGPDPGPGQQNPYGPGGQAPYPSASGTPGGPPPAGYPGGPVGPGAPQQPYGAPQPPYPAYGQGPLGPSGPGQPPNQPGQPAKKGFPKVLIIVGIVVLALIAGGITTAVVLSRSAQTAGPDPGTGSSGGPGASSAPPIATKPSDAVKAYLEALAAGNAEAALALGDSAPSDTTFLTNEVLAASNKLAPITDINVPEVNDEFAYQVAASYKLGKQAVDENFSVTKAGDQWKLRDSFNDNIDMSFRSNRNLPLIVNGVQAKTLKLRLFPGAYEFTTGTDNVSWGEDSVLIVQSPSEYPRGLTDIKPTLTEKGEKAFRDAVKASIDKCLKSNKISNPGCPNNVDPKKINSTYKFKDGTIAWEASRKNEAIEDMSIRLEYSNPSVASASIGLGITAEGDCDAPGGKCSLYPTSSLQPRATMLTNPIKLTWS